MKLERYKDKKETRKKVMLISLTVLTLISVAMMLYKTFANFRQTVSFPIMNGKVIYKPKGKDLTEVVKPTTSGDSSGNGLFAVTPTLKDWTQTEYRYAGPNPNNYVYFNCNNGQEENNDNCELWRIIGKVNVKTSNGTIEQRLKIIRNDSLGNYAWDKNSGYTNDWTKSALKDMLNDGYYYQSTSVICYEGSNGSSSSQSTCSFNGGSNQKGLTSLARDMIDNTVIWNLGGWGTSSVNTEKMYGYERGTTAYPGQPSEWTSSNDSSHHRGVGLMYPSDYGYAVGGKVRSTCLNSTNLSGYITNSCNTNDWLYMASIYQWLLSPDASGRHFAFFVFSSGYVISGSPYVVNLAYTVRPVVYLNSNVKLGEGEGTQSSPYHLIS